MPLRAAAFEAAAVAVSPPRHEDASDALLRSEDVIVQPSHSRPTAGAALRIAEDPQESSCLASFPLETRHVRRVIHPSNEIHRRALSVSQLPHRSAPVSMPNGHRSADAVETEHRGVDPCDECRAGGHERDPEAFVDVAAILPSVIAIRVHGDGSVTVDAASQEITEPFIRHSQRFEAKTLGRHQSNPRNAVMKYAIRPLQAVATPLAARMRRDPGRDPQTPLHRLQEIDVLRHDAVAALTPRCPATCGRLYNWENHFTACRGTAASLASL